MDNYTQENTGSGKKVLWIIGGIVLIIAIVGIVYGATQKTLKNGGASVANIPLTQNSDGTTTTGANQQVMGDSVAVAYSGFDVVNLQTFPYQVQVRVRGSVPDSCTVANTPTVSVSGKTFTVSMNGTRPAGAACAQVITNVSGVVSLPVDGLSAGTYSVKIDNLAAKSFTLSSDNTVQYTSDK